MDSSSKDSLRALPSIDSLIGSDEGKRLCISYGKAAAVKELRAALASLRDASTQIADRQQAAAYALAQAGKKLRSNLPGLVREINATGVVLHTNLGRAPLSSMAIRAAQEAAEGYNDLEYDLAQGRRGSRQAHVAGLAASLIGAEAALVVNNNAAAVLLCLDALAKGGKVAVSRGELVEIGGSFRVPDIMSVTGAVLLEVGTTNRTRVSDYEKAAMEGAAAILKVHPSNFRVTGFTSEVGTRELSIIAKKHDIPLIFDVGSGCMANVEAFGLPSEPSPKVAIEEGADIVTFSADKLLGGPQCGIIAGKADLVAKIARSPLARAFRVDKMRIAALAATLAQYESEDTMSDIPVIAMLKEPFDVTMSRAVKLCSMLKGRAWGRAGLDGVAFKPVETLDEVGGGSLPGATLKGAGVHVSSKGVRPAEAARLLREAKPAVVALERAGGMLFSMRAVREEELASLADAIVQAFGKDEEGT